MMDICENIDLVVNKLNSFGLEFTSFPKRNESSFEGKIPTLKKGVYRESSPMLRCRFEKYKRWENASHGCWLSIDDMEYLWGKSIENDFLEGVKIQVDSLKSEWPNHALSLFRDERISLFAASDISNESIVLLWLDFKDEPEVWTYDANGESKYKNLNEYLLSYLNDDVNSDCLYKAML